MSPERSSGARAARLRLALIGPPDNRTSFRVQLPETGGPEQSQTDAAGNKEEGHPVTGEGRDWRLSYTRATAADTALIPDASATIPRLSARLKRERRAFAAVRQLLREG